MPTKKELLDKALVNMAKAVADQEKAEADRTKARADWHLAYAMPDDEDQAPKP